MHLWVLLEALGIDPDEFCQREVVFCWKKGGLYEATFLPFFQLNLVLIGDNNLLDDKKKAITFEEKAYGIRLERCSLRTVCSLYELGNKTLNFIWGAIHVISGFAWTVSGLSTMGALDHSEPFGWFKLSVLLSWDCTVYTHVAILYNSCCHHHQSLTIPLMPFLTLLFEALFSVGSNLLCMPYLSNSFEVFTCLPTFTSLLNM